MTALKLTSSFDFWSRGHVRMAVMHLPIKFCADVFIQSRVIDQFCRNSRWRPPPSWIFMLCEFGHSGVLIVWTVWYLCSLPNLVQNMLYSLRSTHLSFRNSLDEVTRINFQFRLLVTWSSLHGRDASSHEIWCRYLYPIRGAYLL